MNYCETTVTERVINPKEAQVLLDKGGNFRNINDGRATEYARQMKNGTWEPGMSVILIDEKGMVADGQHRLQAVVLSGIPQSFIVKTGCKRSSIPIIDTGLSRTAAQVLKATHNVPDASRIAAILKGMVFLNRGPSYVPNNEILRVYLKYGDIAKEVLKTTGRSMRTASILIVFARAILVFPERKEDILFALERFGSLDFYQVPGMSGFRYFYQWIMNNNIKGGGGNTRKEVYLRLSRALLAFLNGEELKDCRVPNIDPFPFEEEASNE